MLFPSESDENKQRTIHAESPAARGWYNFPIRPLNDVISASTDGNEAERGAVAGADIAQNSADTTLS